MLVKRISVDAIVEHTDWVTSARFYTIVFRLGGAIGDVGKMDGATQVSM